MSENLRCWVPCDKCHIHWTWVDAIVSTVYDELTMGGRPVIEIERNAQEAKQQTIKAGKQWAVEDWEAFGVDAKGRYTKATVKMPRQVMRYSNAVCKECKGGGKPTI